jgi:peptide/nickel transport system substrate-binding protein
MAIRFQDHSVVRRLARVIGVGGTVFFSLGLIGLMVGSVASATAPAKTPSTSVSIGVYVEPPTLDVHMSGLAIGESGLAGNVYEGLTRLDKNEAVAPSLAVSWKRTSSLEWRFELRRGVNFQNGEPFTPAAAVYSIKRALNPASENLAYWGFIKGARVAGSHAIYVTTSAPDPNVSRGLTFLMMVPPKYVRGHLKEFQSHAIGTGPYRFARWVHGQYYQLSYNSNYWGEKAAFKTVTFKILSDSAVRLDALRAGEIQIAQNVSPQDAGQVPKVRANVSNEVCQIRLNTQAGVFQDLRLRQAANYAIDRGGIIKALYSGFATLPHAQLITRASFGFDPTLKDYPYDPTKAKALLAAAGYSKQPITIVGEEGRWPNDRSLELAVVNDLQQVGFNVQFTIASQDVWVNVIYKKAEADGVFYCPSDDTLAGTRALLNLLTPGSPQSTYDNPTIGAQLARMAVEFDDAKRAKEIHAISAGAKANAPFILLVSIDRIYGMAANVGFTPRRDGQILLTDVKVLTK